MRRHINGWMFAFIVVFIFLFLIIVVAIVDVNAYSQQTYRISRAIENQNVCSGYNSGICELHVNFDLPIPSPLNPSGYSQPLALFAGNMVASVEYGFLQNPGSSKPSIQVPFAVTKITDLIYNNNTIGVVCVGGGTIWVAFRGTRTSQEWDQDLMFQQVRYPHSTMYPVTQRYYSLYSTDPAKKQNPSRQASSPNFQGLVHEGFLDVYDCLRDQLQTAINNLPESLFKMLP